MSDIFLFTGILALTGVGKEGSPAFARGHHAGQLSHEPAPHVSAERGGDSSQQREWLRPSVRRGHQPSQVLGGRKLLRRRMFGRDSEDPSVKKEKRMTDP